MFLQGLEKPWWAAASVVWVLITFTLTATQGVELLTASRIALAPAALVGLGVWWVVGRGRKPPAA